MIPLASMFLSAALSHRKLETQVLNATWFIPADYYSYHASHVRAELFGMLP